MGLALAANAGRIHKAELAAFEFDDLVHGVAGGAGDGRDDGSGCARERVQQRGLAHVGPADDGHRGFVLLELAVGAVQRTQLLVRCLCRDIFRFRGVEIRGGLGFLGGQRLVLRQRGLRRRRNCLRNSVQQVADAKPVLGADGKDVANAQLAKVLGSGGHGVALNLVYGQKHGLAAANQQLHQVVVGAGQLSARIHHQHQCIGLFERHLGLGVDRRGHQFRVVGHDAAGVDQAKLPAGPIVLAIDAVAGDAGLVPNNGSAALGEPIEERGFAHVGPAHNGHQRQRFRA